MINEASSHFHPKKYVALYFCLLCVLMIGTALGQGQAIKTGSVADAISKVKEGKFAAVHIEEIARAGQVQAIPILKEQFARSQDPAVKAKLADALIRLGDKNQSYWDFLVQQANEAIESDMPYPNRFDSQGKMVRREFSPDFIEWCKIHHVTPDSAGEAALYKLPGKLIFLAETADPRGVPFLRQAMLSPNYMIQAFAAKGLAKLQDKESIPLIIGACEKAPVDIAPAIAEALLFFDDPRAQGEADVYLPKEYARALRESRKVPGNDVFYH